MPRQYYAQKQRVELSGSSSIQGESYTSMRIADDDGNFNTYRIEFCFRLGQSGSTSVDQVSFGYYGAHRVVLVEIDNALIAGDIVAVLN